MTKSSSPISSFGPELMVILREGSEKRCTYDLPSSQAAFRLMSRINALRAAMRRESHPDSDRVYRAGVKIDRENRCRVIVEPKDSEFRNLLSNSSPLAELTAQNIPVDPPGVAEDSADVFLSDLAKKPDPS